MTTQIECTFKEALRNCKIQGGEMTDGEYILAVKDGAYVELQEKTFRPSLDDIFGKSKWFHRSSVFQEWLKSKKLEIASQNDKRKEGWNAAIDAVLFLKKIITGDVISNGYVPVDEIEKLKEP